MFSFGLASLFYFFLLFPPCSARRPVYAAAHFGLAATG